MNTEQFAYWLQGYVELNNGEMPDSLQWQIIKDHLKTVFDKKTPNRLIPDRGTPLPPVVHPHLPQSPFGGPSIIC